MNAARTKSVQINLDGYKLNLKSIQAEIQVAFMNLFHSHFFEWKRSPDLLIWSHYFLKCISDLDKFTFLFQLCLIMPFSSYFNDGTMIKYLSFLFQLCFIKLTNTFHHGWNYLLISLMFYHDCKSSYFNDVLSCLQIPSITDQFTFLFQLCFIIATMDKFTFFFIKLTSRCFIKLTNTFHHRSIYLLISIMLYYFFYHMFLSCLQVPDKITFLFQWCFIMLTITFHHR